MKSSYFLKTRRSNSPTSKSKANPSGPSEVVDSPDNNININADQRSKESSQMSAYSPYSTTTTQKTNNNNSTNVSPNYNQLIDNHLYNPQQQQQLSHQHQHHHHHHENSDSSLPPIFNDRDTSDIVIVAAGDRGLSGEHNENLAQHSQLGGCRSKSLEQQQNQKQQTKDKTLIAQTQQSQQQFPFTDREQLSNVDDTAKFHMEFYAHKQVLGACSSFFRDFLVNDEYYYSNSNPSSGNSSPHSPRQHNASSPMSASSRGDNNNSISPTNTGGRSSSSSSGNSSGNKSPCRRLVVHNVLPASLAHVLQSMYAAYNNGTPHSVQCYDPVQLSTCSSSVVICAWELSMKLDLRLMASSLTHMLVPMITKSNSLEVLKATTKYEHELSIVLQRACVHSRSLPPVLKTHGDEKLWEELCSKIPWLMTTVGYVEDADIYQKASDTLLPLSKKNLDLQEKQKDDDEYTRKRRGGGSSGDGTSSVGASTADAWDETRSDKNNNDNNLQQQEEENYQQQEPEDPSSFSRHVDLLSDNNIHQKNSILPISAAETGIVRPFRDDNIQNKNKREEEVVMDYRQRFGVEDYHQPEDEQQQQQQNLKSSSATTTRLTPVPLSSTEALCLKSDRIIPSSSNTNLVGVYRSHSAPNNNYPYEQQQQIPSSQIPVSSLSLLNTKKASSSSSAATMRGEKKFLPSSNTRVAAQQREAAAASSSSGNFVGLGVAAGGASSRLAPHNAYPHRFVGEKDSSSAFPNNKNMTNTNQILALSNNNTSADMKIEATKQVLKRNSSQKNNNYNNDNETATTDVPFSSSNVRSQSQQQQQQPDEYLESPLFTTTATGTESVNQKEPTTRNRNKSQNETMLSPLATATSISRFGGTIQGHIPSFEQKFVKSSTANSKLTVPKLALKNISSSEQQQQQKQGEKINNSEVVLLEDDSDSDNGGDGANNNNNIVVVVEDHQQISSSENYNTTTSDQQQQFLDTEKKKLLDEKKSKYKLQSLEKDVQNTYDVYSKEMNDYRATYEQLRKETTDLWASTGLCDPGNVPASTAMADEMLEKIESEAQHEAKIRRELINALSALELQIEEDEKFDVYADDFTRATAFASQELGTFLTRLRSVVDQQHSETNAATQSVLAPAYNSNSSNTTGNTHSSSLSNNNTDNYYPKGMLFDYQQPQTQVELSAVGKIGAAAYRQLQQAVEQQLDETMRRVADDDREAEAKLRAHRVTLQQLQEDVEQEKNKLEMVKMMMVESKKK